MRTFLPPTDGDFSPQGHRDDDGDWVYYVTQPNGLPSDLVDGRGVSVGTLSSSVFGAHAKTTGRTTEVRALGQLADEETGLFYNRYRYYDPELGRFISEDPIGLEGGSNLYAYGPNPVGWVDPLGWHTITVTSSPTIMAALRPSYTADTADTGNQASRHANDSEQQMVNDLRALHGRNPDALLGQQVTATGTLPPCPTCHKAMQNAARDTGATIAYQYPTNNAVTYTGGTAPGPDGTTVRTVETVGTGPAGRRVVNAYAGTQNLQDDRCGAWDAYTKRYGEETPRERERAERSSGGRGGSRGPR